MHRAHYKIKKRLANISGNVSAARLMIVEAIADDEARAYALEFLKQIEGFSESAYQVIEKDRKKHIQELNIG